MLQMLFFALLAGSSAILAKRLLPQKGVVENVCAGGIIFFWLASMVFNVLINLKLFYPIPATTLAATIFLTTCRLLPVPGYLQDFWAKLSKLAGKFFLLCNDGKTRKLATSTFVTFACFLLLRSLLLPMNCWDSLTYHTLKANLWVQRGCHYNLASPGLWESYKTFFGGGEAFTALSMVFTHSDLFGSIPDFFLWLLMGVLAFSLMRELNGKSGSALAITGAFLAIPALTRMVASGYIDMGVSTFLLAGILFFIRLLKTRNSSYLLLSAASYGLAASLKVNGLAVSLVMIAILIVITLARKAASVWLAAATLATFAAPVVPWFLFNYQASGFILGTTPAKIGSLFLGQMPLPLVYFFSEPSIQAYSFWHELEASAQTLSSLGLFALIVVFAVTGLIARLQKIDIIVMVALIQCLTVLGLYFSPSFSVIRLVWSAANSRFIVSAIMLLIAVGLPSVDRRNKATSKLIQNICLFAIGASALDYILKFVFTDNYVIEIFLLVAAMGCTALTFRLFYKVSSKATPSSSFSLFLLIIICSAAFGITGTLKDSIRLRAYEGSVISHDHPRYWTVALKQVNDKQNVSIAFTYGMDKLYHSAFIAPFFGEKLQNRISYISPLEDGRTPVYHPDYIGKEPYNYESWLKRLQKAGITHLLCFAPKCQELSWARNHPETFEMLEGNRVWGFFALR